MGLCFFFFFQAEDGIRDVAVTGVQTCALPIWRERQSQAAACDLGGYCTGPTHPTGGLQVCYISCPYAGTVDLAGFQAIDYHQAFRAGRPSIRGMGALALGERTTDSCKLLLQSLRPWWAVG